MNLTNVDGEKGYSSSGSFGPNQGSTTHSSRQIEHSQTSWGNNKSTSKSFLANLSSSLILAYQSFGVVYGDLSTSPLYVYRSTFIGKLDNYHNPDVIFGVCSLIFWALTLIPLLKYTVIMLGADDNGQGGTIALYSLLCRHGKFSILPNQQAADEELSTYKYGPLGQASSSLEMKMYFEKHKWIRTALLVIVLIGAGMLIGDGVFSPAMSVLSSIPILSSSESWWAQYGVQTFASAILVGLFTLQHYGTRKVGVLFAPIVILWLLSIFVIGLYNIFYWNPKIVYALSPHYIVKFLAQTGSDGWVSLGGVLLCITGSEAMFADLGHFTSCSIRIAFVFVVYPCLVVQYMGQAAFLSKNIYAIPNSFYASIPDLLLGPVFVIALLAAVVGSQAIISASFSIIMQCQALSCFPRVKIVHTSKQIYGQIYIPEINWILMILTITVVIGLHDTDKIGNAYGLSVISVMLITTLVMALVVVFVWQMSEYLAAVFFFFFCTIETLFLSAAYFKVPQGGWLSIALSLFITLVMFVWHYGTRKKYIFNLHNKVPLKWILSLGPSLGIARVPGIGLIYSELVTGLPPIFSHFVTNLPAFHNVLVFVSMKSVPIPHVSHDERFLIGRVCPRPYRMYRCIVRYGYKDNKEDDHGNFENMLVKSIAEFIEMEASEAQYYSQSPSLEYTLCDGKMAVISSRTLDSALSLVLSEVEEVETIDSNQMRWEEEDESPRVKKHQVKFQLRQNPAMDPEVREELMDLIEAKEAGVSYIMGHSYIKARRSSPLLKKLVIDFGYAFLRRNCRGSALGLQIPQTNLIQVGIMYYL